MAGNSRGSVVLLATLGFGIDFVVRRLRDIHAEGERVSKILAVGLWTDEATWARIDQAYSILRSYLQSLGIDSELLRIDLGKASLVREAVKAIAKALAVAGREEIVELYLTGGPRILLAAFYTAALLSPEWSDRLRVVVYGEGFQASLRVSLGVLRGLIELDQASLKILRVVKEKGGSISTLLAETGLPRSTLYKKLGELEKRGLVVKTGRGEIDLASEIKDLF